MNATSPVPTTELSFRELITRYQRVRIPVIQRDYAQGRDSAHEVRDEFLHALHTALAREPGDPALPLNLDFVYGRREDSACFAPLDGQQRLTTLFLLHWYLAWHDGEYTDFASFIREGDSSRFGYAIRPSSREFFDALSGWVPALMPRADTLPATLVRDQNWFFEAWNADPTIQAALAMLNAIHRRFYGAHGMYARLAHAERPYITLHLLDLDRFALADDLYIKMNARGKPLTPFEHFKAQFEAHLATMSSARTYSVRERPATLKEYVSHRIDGAWTDLFWHALKAKPELLDQSFMRLIHVVVIVTRDPRSPDIEKLLSELHDAATPLSFRRYQDAGCVDQAFVETLIAVLDAWSGADTGMRAVLGDSPYFDERAAFDAILRGGQRWTYTRLVQFHAYAAFIVHFGREPARHQFRDWLRIIANLARNSALDNVSTFRLSLATMQRLLPHASAILDHFASGPLDVQGFIGLQVDEERLKAALILRDETAWRGRVERAEQHGYFQGQIGFLLKFAGIREAWKSPSGIDWTPPQDEALRRRFDEYYVRALALFTDAGLRDFPDQVFERALLSIGDYLLKADSNWSFGESTGRDTSWKRLLRGNGDDDGDDAKRRAMFQVLLDRIDPDAAVTPQLEDIVRTTPPTGDWREPFIRYPQMIRYCGMRMIRFHNENHVYLLRKQRMSGEHAELYTYHLHVSALHKMTQEGSFAPFTEARYEAVDTDREEPCIQLRGEVAGAPLILEIRHEPSTVFFAFALTASVAKPTAERLAAVGFAASTDGTLRRAVPRGDAISALSETISALYES
ncbi:DUF262 domain-containing protein [Massilia sp. TN1-12]|uniref:DUF262 domain-containing protein n=1 Tax=Massilia paldalensis TaxID=3377675 RepID=UPI00384F7901